MDNSSVSNVINIITQSNPSTPKNPLCKRGNEADLNLAKLDKLIYKPV